MPQSIEIHQKGTVSANGTELSENTKNIEDVRRNVGVVFKSFNSFPHLSGLGKLRLGGSPRTQKGQSGDPRDGDEIS